MDNPAADFSIAVFPFLNTTGRVTIGDHVFRPLSDTEDLPIRQSTMIDEIRTFFFQIDDDPIPGGTFAVTPPVLHAIGPMDETLERLSIVQAAVAFVYSYSGRTDGRPFLTFEHTTSVVLTPALVPTMLIGQRRPGGQRVQSTVPGVVSGFNGIYNFTHHFWVASGSRIYPPLPHLAVNTAQDLSDAWERLSQIAWYRLLFRTLSTPTTEFTGRVWIAIRWFNRANASQVDESVALVSLAIALESLLGLPRNTEGKSDRIVDAVALLLGRVPRLDDWGRQFYDARSRIVHEGFSAALALVVRAGRKGEEPAVQQPLLSYGRHIFRACLATLLTGAETAFSSGLQERLIPNHERFAELCRIFDDSTIPAEERLKRAAPIIEAIERHRDITDTGLRIDAMLAATKLGAKAFLEFDGEAQPNIKNRLIALINVPNKAPHLEAIAALEALDETISSADSLTSVPGMAMRELARTVWQSVKLYYLFSKLSVSQ